METKITEINDCKKLLEATLPYEEMIPDFEAAVINYRKKVSIPGFRKGKAPLAMIKKNYADAIEYSALEDIAEKTLKKYIIENKVNMVGTGSLIDLDYKPKESLLIKVEFEYLPEFTVENYKNLELTKNIYKFDKSLVDEEIHHILFRRATREIDGQVLDNEYEVTIDSQEIDEAGSPIIGRAEKDVVFYVGDKRLDKNLLNAIKDIRENETRNVDIIDKEEQPIKYQIKCKKINKLVYPEITEEFLKSVTYDDSVKTREDFEKYIEKRIKDSYEELSQSELEKQVIAEIVKLNDVKVPEHFVKIMLDSQLEEFREKNKEYFKKFGDTFNEEDFRKERTGETLYFLKWHLLRDKISELENLEINDDDYLKYAEKFAARYNIPADKLVEVFKKNKDENRNILESKVINFIITNSTVKEVEKDLSQKKEN